MKSWTLIKRSVWFYRRTNLGVMLGVMTAATVLTGSLIVGDCLRYTLHQMALNRLGLTQLAMQIEYPSMDEELLANAGKEPNTILSGVLQFRGVVTSQATQTRAYQVQINGVDRNFWRIGQTDNQLEGLPHDQVAINDHLARRLNIKVGDTIVMRYPKPSALSLDMPLGSEADDSVVFNAIVGRIVTDQQFGRFSLDASQVAPLNVFVRLSQLSSESIETWTGGPLNTFNILLVSGTDVDQKITAKKFMDDNGFLFNYEQVGYYFPLKDSAGYRDQLATRRIFFQPQVANAINEKLPPHDVALSYLANELRIGNRTTPYSIVCAYGDSKNPNFSRVINQELAPDDVIINQWLADDLNAKVGDQLTMKYNIVGQGRKLEESSHTFTVRAIIPTQGIGADRSLMPKYPGIADSDDINNWEPGIPIDMSKIHDEDEEYWDEYRGSPKAFVNLTTGQKLWGNRWGNVTAMRFKQGSNMPGQTLLYDTLTPDILGFTFRPVRQQALDAATNGQDFTGLFMGMSFFLIIAAMLLTAMLFVFNVEQRAPQIGTMLSLGFTPRKLLRLMLAEGFMLAVVGSIIGLFGAIAFAWLTLKGLATIWQGAVGTADLLFIITPKSLGTGVVITVIIALGSIWLAIRKLIKRSPRELLGGSIGLTAVSHKRSIKPIILTFVCAIGAAVMVVASNAVGGAEQQAMLFFGAGSMQLIALIAATAYLLHRMARPTANLSLRLGQLGRRNCARRVGRSLATVTLLACGLFMIIAVGANHLSPPANPAQRSSPTGGFMLYAESALPIYHDLNSAEGREYYGMDDEQLEQVHFVQLRVRAGDDASCLNLNRPQQPRLIGVPIDQMKQLKPFTITIDGQLSKSANPWQALHAGDANDNTSETNDTDKKGDAIPAFVDAGTAQWILHKKPGDTITYTDAQGQSFEVKIVGLLNNTICQGSLLISEKQFIERFPDTSGYRAFMIDTPTTSAAIQQTMQLLSRNLSDVGFDVTTTTDRLAQFNAVQNTYLMIFAALGGLGLILGSVGLGVVAARNIFERRGELALMQAVGFSKKQLTRMILAEHHLLLGLGMIAGIASAAVAIGPVLSSTSTSPPLGLLGSILVGVVVTGSVWIRIAAYLAMRSPALDALRQE